MPIQKEYKYNKNHEEEKKLNEKNEVDRRRDCLKRKSKSEGIFKNKKSSDEDDLDYFGGDEKELNNNK